jgi:hypothetical protein
VREMAQTLYTHMTKQKNKIKIGIELEHILLQK